MDFDWDDGKDAANRAKHGLSLRDARSLDWTTAMVQRDLRLDYGEIRFIAFANLGARLHTCVYTRRNRTRRIISLRKSNKRERVAYDKFANTSAD